MPVELNGVKLSFVLDTGVSRPILFNLVDMDSLQMKNTDRIYLRGLGDQGRIEAVRSKGNIIKVGEAIAVNRDVSVVFDANINFTPRLGVPVHGIIGFDIFRDFVVEINYSSKYIRLHKTQFFKQKTSKKWQTLSIDLHNRKPYLNAHVNIHGETIPVKLLIDSGGSDAIWLFEDINKGITVPKDLYFDDFLGRGLSGSVYGKRSKLKQFDLGTYALKDVNVAFPDSMSLSTARLYKPRNGSISGNILKRFNIFFDYRHGKLHLKRNSNYKTAFYYNNSGITVEQEGMRFYRKIVKSGVEDGYGNKNVHGIKTIETTPQYELHLIPAFYIVELRESSNAKKAGLQIGDLITSINNRSTSDMSLQKVNAFFHDKKGKPIKLRVQRNGKILSFLFKLDDVFEQKKSLQK